MGDLNSTFDYYELVIEALETTIRVLEKENIDRCHECALLMEDNRTLHHDLNNALQVAMVNGDLLKRIKQKLLDLHATE